MLARTHGTTLGSNGRRDTETVATAIGAPPPWCSTYLGKKAWLALPPALHSEGGGVVVVGCVCVCIPVGMCTPSGYVLSLFSSSSSRHHFSDPHGQRFSPSHTHTLVLFQQVRLRLYTQWLSKSYFIFGEGEWKKRKIIQIGGFDTKPFWLTLAAILEVFFWRGEKMNVFFFAFEKLFWNDAKKRRKCWSYSSFWLRLVRHYYYLVSCRQHTWCSEER